MLQSSIAEVIKRGLKTASDGSEAKLEENQHEFPNKIFCNKNLKPTEMEKQVRDLNDFDEPGGVSMDDKKSRNDASEWIEQITDQGTMSLVNNSSLSNLPSLEMKQSVIILDRLHLSSIDSGIGERNVDNFRGNGTTWNLSQTTNLDPQQMNAEDVLNEEIYIAPSFVTEFITKGNIPLSDIALMVNNVGHRIMTAKETKVEDDLKTLLKLPTDGIVFYNASLQKVYVPKLIARCNECGTYTSRNYSGIIQSHSTENIADSSNAVPDCLTQTFSESLENKNRSAATLQSIDTGSKDPDVIQLETLDLRGNESTEVECQHSDEIVALQVKRDGTVTVSRVNTQDYGKVKSQGQPTDVSQPTQISGNRELGLDNQTKQLRTKQDTDETAQPSSSEEEMHICGMSPSTYNRIIDWLLHSEKYSPEFSFNLTDLRVISRTENTEEHLTSENEGPDTQPAHLPLINNSNVIGDTQFIAMCSGENNLSELSSSVVASDVTQSKGVALNLPPINADKNQQDAKSITSYPELPIKRQDQMQSEKFPCITADFVVTVGNGEQSMGQDSLAQSSNVESVGDNIKLNKSDDKIESATFKSDEGIEKGSKKTDILQKQASNVSPQTQTTQRSRSTGHTKRQARIKQQKNSTRSLKTTAHKKPKPKKLKGKSQDTRQPTDHEDMNNTDSYTAAQQVILTPVKITKYN